ncbi:ParA family protein (plasmid) [Acaryochloris sp. 'Moss Beach']|uniref:ParA family protein n=1 Tax=Acaryochloris sp. 'Moss Beach' TaxID=2740837 RepID=UPI001F1757F1|nr:ParA family protein [Acaryochloris sp. 'Moss Beach']UJB73262.1 ParA family protein [Acaryochloris sp. 'Moss Beach']
MKYISFVSKKGGVAKSTSAIHYAYWLTKEGYEVALIDDDANRTVLKWQARANDNPKFSPPFVVASFAKMAKAVAGVDFVILDTQASISDDDLKDLAEDSDLVVIPTKVDVDSASAATETAKAINDSKGTYRILLTDVLTSGTAGAELAEDLKEDGYLVLESFVRRGEGVRHASLAGATLAQQPGKYRMPWRDYQKVFSEIHSIID